MKQTTSSKKIAPELAPAPAHDGPDDAALKAKTSNKKIILLVLAIGFSIGSIAISVLMLTNVINAPLLASITMLALGLLTMTASLIKFYSKDTKPTAPEAPTVPSAAPTVPSAAPKVPSTIEEVVESYNKHVKKINPTTREEQLAAGKSFLLQYSESASPKVESRAEKAAQEIQKGIVKERQGQLRNETFTRPQK